MAIYIRYTTSAFTKCRIIFINVFLSCFSIELVYYLPWPIKLCSIVRLRETTHLISIIRTKWKSHFRMKMLILWIIRWPFIHIDWNSCSVCKISRNELQLLGAACLLIASKGRETVTLSSAKLVIYTDNSITADQLLVRDQREFTFARLFTFEKCRPLFLLMEQWMAKVLIYQFRTWSCCCC